MELSRIEFKIVYRAWKIFYIARILYFSAQFTLISRTSFSNCLETWIPIERSKYRNHIEWKILSSKLSNSYFFQHVLNHFEKLFMSCSREHLAHKLPHHRFDIRMFILFIERAHTRAHTLAREIAAKRIEETILSTGNDTRGEFPTGTRSTRL